MNSKILPLAIILLMVLGGFGAVATQTQISENNDIAALQELAEEKGWTFTIGENSATKRSLDELCGEVIPDDWWVDEKFDPCIPSERLPDTFDWRTQNGVTPIKDQGNCGSCWAFATVGVLECNIRIASGDLVDLSEQWLVSCNQDGWGCGTGWFAHDYHWWKTDSYGGTGAVMEGEFPYVGYGAPCDGPYSHYYKIVYWAYIGSDQGIPPTEAIKQAILDYGPVSSAVYATTAMLAYSGGIFNNCESGEVNHAVTIVGWDDHALDEYGQEHSVWIVKNSWGPGWGEDGYMRIPYNCSNIGYAACYIIYPGRPLLDGYCYYEDMSPANNITVDIINMNTSRKWQADTVDNHYYIKLIPGIHINTTEILRLTVRDNAGYVNVTDHVLTQSEIYSGQITVNLTLNEYYLDLTDFPMYLAQYIGGYTVDQMTGPAVLQMNLDYMWWNSSVDIDPPTWSENNGWDQAELYDRGVENNSNTSLPLIDATGLHHMIQNLDPEPYSEYGYNFGIYHDADSEYMLKQIVKWIDYPAGIKPGHPLHVPGAVPTFGNYSRWMSVRGIHMNQTAYPLPSALDVFGFWVNDPYPSGIGENTYKISVEWTNNYYQPISVADDPYYGEYIAICEPPLPEEECDLTLVVPPEQWEPLDEPPEQRIGMSAFFLRQVNDDAVVKAAIDGVTDQLIPYDSNFEEVFKQSYAGRPMLVENLAEEKGDYYAVPFTNVPTMQAIPREDHGDVEEETTMVVVLVDANDGHFKEASWVDNPVRYLPISSADALDIVFDELIDMGINLEELNVREIKTDLVYKDLSPYYPDWRVVINELGLTFFVDQDGTLR